MLRRLIAPLIALATLAGALAITATPAAASNCQTPIYTNTLIGSTWFPGFWNGAYSGGGGRSVCYSGGVLDGTPSSRYYRLRVSVQDLVDYGNDSRSVCVYYATPGTSQTHYGVCDFNSLDWNYQSFDLVVDSWASGPPDGFRFGIYVEMLPNVWQLATVFHMSWYP